MGEAAVGPLLDISGALIRLGGDKRLLGDLIEFFFDDAFGLLLQINHCAADNDLGGARRDAHRLKGLVANFGAAPAVAALQAVETYPDGEDAGMAVLVRRANRELARLGEALARFSPANEEGRTGAG